MRNLWKAALAVVVILVAATGSQAQTVLATLNYPNGVNGVAIDYEEHRAYVLLPNFDNGLNSIQVLDTLTYNVLATYDVPVANAIAVNVETGLVYVGGSVESTTNPSGVESEVVVLKGKTGEVKATIPVTATGGFGIVALAVNPENDHVYVSNASDNTIAIISRRRNAVTAQVSLNGLTPAGLAVDFERDRVYVATGSSQLAILRRSEESEIETVTYATYGSQTSYVAVNPFRRRVYVTDGVFDVPTVGVLNTRGVVKASVAVGLFPQGVDVDFVTDLVFVANEGDGTVSEIDGLSNTVLNTYPIPANTIAVDPTQKAVYAVGSASVIVFAE